MEWWATVARWWGWGMGKEWVSWCLDREGQKGKFGLPWSAWKGFLPLPHGAATCGIPMIPTWLHSVSHGGSPLGNWAPPPLCPVTKCAVQGHDPPIHFFLRLLWVDTAHGYNSRIMHLSFFVYLFVWLQSLNFIWNQWFRYRIWEGGRGGVYNTCVDNVDFILLLLLLFVLIPILDRILI